MSGKAYVGPWTADEEAILLDYYQKAGWKVCSSLLPRRTQKAIMVRAQMLGLARRKERQCEGYDGESYGTFMRAQDRRFIEAFLRSGEGVPT